MSWSHVVFEGGQIESGLGRVKDKRETVEYNYKSRIELGASLVI